MESIIQPREDYDKELCCYKKAVRIRYYSRRQMKALYPHRNFWVAGEIGGRTGILCGIARSTDGCAVPVYRVNTHNRVTEAVIGYAAVDRHTYLAVVKNDLPQKIVVLVSVLAWTAVGASLFFGWHPR